MFKKKDGKDALTLVVKFISLEMATGEARWLQLGFQRGNTLTYDSNRFFYRNLQPDEK
jgi:hypothetical protein